MLDIQGVFHVFSRLRVLIVVVVAFTALSLVGSPRVSPTSSPGEPQTKAQPSTDMTAGLSVPPGATPEMVALGFHLFRGEPAEEPAIPATARTQRALLWPQT